MKLQERTPVPILQNEWEFEQLLEIYKKHKPEHLIEIGTFFGGTLYHWLKENDNLKSVICVDLPIGKDDGRYDQMIDSRKKWDDWVMESTVTPHNFYDIKGDSTSINVYNRVHHVSLNHHDKADFLFIDGDHSYEGVKSDYENYQDLVRPGGLVVFHDVIGYWTVNKFWNEVKKDKKYIEICAGGPDGWGIGIIEK